MKNETGPRLGWTLGGIGSIVWMPLLGGVMLAKGNAAGACINFLLFLAALAYIVFLAPWKLPDTPFRNLYSGLLILLAAAAFMTLALWNPNGASLKSHWHLLLFLAPCLTPLFTLGSKTWRDMHGRRPPGQDPTP